MCSSDLESISCSVVPDSLQPHGLQPTKLLCPWDFPDKDTGVVSHFPSPGNLPPALWQILYQMRYQESHYINIHMYIYIININIVFLNTYTQKQLHKEGVITNSVIPKKKLKFREVFILEPGLESGFGSGSHA